VKEQFDQPTVMRVWANWCRVQGIKAEVQRALNDGADEIERLRAALGRIAHAESSVLNAEQFARAESMLQRWAADALK
jgi:hypothetical protein